LALFVTSAKPVARVAGWRISVLYAGAGFLGFQYERVLNRTIGLEINQPCRTILP
jgi:hypothetical protein